MSYIIYTCIAIEINHHDQYIAISIYTYIQYIYVCVLIMCMTSIHNHANIYIIIYILYVCVTTAPSRHIMPNFALLLQHAIT